MVLSPDCPLCGQPPTLVVSLEFAMCGNEECVAIKWNMSMTVEENKREISFVSLQSLDDAAE